VAVDGDIAVVGAAGNGSGSVYVYVRFGSTWTQQTILLASDGTADDLFGGSAARWL